MNRCSACSARARKLRNAHVLIGRTIKPGRVCSACERLGWLLVLGEDKPRPTTKRALERQLRGAKAVMQAAASLNADLTGSMGRCPVVWISGTRSARCQLQKHHGGQHVARWGEPGKDVRWTS